MPVEITKKQKPKTVSLHTKIDVDTNKKINEMVKAVNQTRVAFFRDAIADRLIYLQGCVDQENSDV
tara:strand:- start:10 stop:207 length:198 start_codon:yes stop_codon:yes gene_type:complete